MGKTYKFEREIMTFDGLQYIVIRMKHALFKDQWKDRCRVFLYVNKEKKNV
jgi:hypothetical protein